MSRNYCFAARVAVWALTSLAIALVPNIAHAQSVVDPTTAEFDPSADHSATASDGTPLVNHYDLEFYLSGATLPFQVLGLNKPAPAADGKIRVNFATLLAALPSPGILYQSTVAAIGPGGTGRSTFSNTFSFSVPCSYTVAPTSATPSAAGGAASLSVTAGTGCGWSAASNITWITVTGGSSGSGNGTVNYTVAANTATSPRSATLTVAGQTVTVTQRASGGPPAAPRGLRVGQIGK